MTESEQTQLQVWDRVLALQLGFFDSEIRCQTGGHRREPDQQGGAFWRAEEDRLRESIDRAIESFLRDGAWPTLAAGECLNLIFRIAHAHQVIDHILKGTPAGKNFEKDMPDLNDREHAIRWLLLDLWSVGGEEFLEEKADDFLRWWAQMKTGSEKPLF